MATTHLPPLNFDDGGLRIVLLPTDDAATDPDPSYSDAGDSDNAADTGHPEPQPAEQTIPVHPIPAMQEAFADSLEEVTRGTAAKPNLRALDAKARRERLLEQESDATPFDAAWRYRPAQRQHEVLKLIAQISFGVYLLLNGMANNNSQVVTILQGHIDEVDEFLEVTLEDLAQATKDFTGRIDYLNLPMSNLKVFEELLEDRGFRAEILEGNEKIEHILARTNVAMKQWDNDIEVGLRCSQAFAAWLTLQTNGPWRAERPELDEVFSAMQGNAEGWQNAFDELNNRAQDMNSLIIRLMTTVAEMEKKAGEISRKTWASIPPFSSPARNSRAVDTASMSSPPSSFSAARSTPRASIRSGGSISTIQPVRGVVVQPVVVEDLDDEFDEDDDDDDGLGDFPLPGAAPLLPPRSSARPSVNFSVGGKSLHIDTTAKTVVEKVTEVSPEDDETPKSGVVEAPLYLLQPRTYTPQPPEPLPSPMVRDSPKTTSTTVTPTSPQPSPNPVVLQKRTSLRQRVSLKTNPPESIQIPPRHAPDSQAHRPSHNYASPRTANSQAHDSAYGSDIESPHRRHGSRPRVSSHADLFPPVRPPLMPSPRSDHQQYYHPVRASPHSPLQQRPHTAGPSGAHRVPSGYHAGHQRNQPSRLGGMSMLSTVTTATNDDRVRTPGMATQPGDKRLKKKKSAFGWLKKAFSLDDDERVAFEAAKSMQHRDQYYEGKSPKFLDGKRIR